MSNLSSQTREWFARNVRLRRLALGLTQIDLAERLDVSQPVVSDLENDRYSPSLDVVHNVAEALETTSDMLLQDPAKKAPRKKSARAAV
jgi:transcriptional regulator with XRE-family HTH domain